MKMSSVFDDREKTIRFKQMLLVYHELMAAWALNMFSEGEIPTHEHWSVPLYVARTRQIVESRNNQDPNQLLPSPAFSVNAAVLGPKTQYARHFPKTMEDLLTLEHQNLLVFLGIRNLSIMSLNAIKYSQLPEAFKHVIHFIEQPFSRDRQTHTIQRSGIALAADGITYRGNFPLRNHSGQLELIYEKATQQMTIKASFMGDARMRWAVIAEWVKVLGITRVMNLEGLSDVGAQEVSFSWRADPSTTSRAMCEFFNMGEYSLYLQNTPNFPDSVLERVVPATDSEENKKIIDNLMHYCVENPESLFAQCFNKKVASSAFPLWILQRGEKTALT